MFDTATGKDRKKPLRVNYFGTTIEVDPAGRRVWPKDLGLRLAAESFRSQLTVEAFAKEWDLCPSVLSRWRMQAVKDGTLPNRAETRPKPSSEPAFAPLVCEAAPSPVINPSRLRSTEAERITLELECGGVLARLPIDTPPEQLRQIVCVLRGSA